jgi:hypothetical protein
MWRVTIDGRNVPGGQVQIYRQLCRRMPGGSWDLRLYGGNRSNSRLGLPRGARARMLAEPLLLVDAPLASLAALLASAGPRRGRQLMRRRHWVYLAAGSAGGAALTLRLSIFVNTPSGLRCSP